MLVKIDILFKIEKGSGDHKWSDCSIDRSVEITLFFILADECPFI
jgi:hypothetical protein